METTDYCSYELSKALKAAGFNEPCNYGYSVKMRLEPELSFGEPKMVHSKDPKNYNDNRKGIEKGLSFCSAVPLWHAQKWLREKKGIDICVCRSFSVNNGYHYELMKDRNFEDMTAQSICAGRSYEQSLSDAIAAALELIKTGE